LLLGVDDDVNGDDGDGITFFLSFVSFFVVHTFKLMHANRGPGPVTHSDIHDLVRLNEEIVSKQFFLSILLLIAFE
jgi:hypothetical protein